MAIDKRREKRAITVRNPAASKGRKSAPFPSPVETQRQPRPPLRDILRSELGVVLVEQVFDDESELCLCRCQGHPFPEAQIDAAERALCLIDADGAISALPVV